MWFSLNHCRPHTTMSINLHRVRVERPPSPSHMLKYKALFGNYRHFKEHVGKTSNGIWERPDCDMSDANTHCEHDIIFLLRQGLVLSVTEYAMAITL